MSTADNRGCLGGSLLGTYNAPKHPPFLTSNVSAIFSICLWCSTTRLIDFSPLLFHCIPAPIIHASETPGYATQPQGSPMRLSSLPEILRPFAIQRAAVSENIQRIGFYKPWSFWMTCFFSPRGKPGRKLPFSLALHFPSVPAPAICSETSARSRC